MTVMVYSFICLFIYLMIEIELEHGKTLFSVESEAFCLIFIIGLCNVKLKIYIILACTAR